MSGASCVFRAVWQSSPEQHTAETQATGCEYMRQADESNTNGERNAAGNSI